MNKKTLSEGDICTKFISPVIKNAAWNKLTQYLEEVSFRDGVIYFSNPKIIVASSSISALNLLIIIE